MGYEKYISETLTFTQILRETVEPHNYKINFQIYPGDHESHSKDIEPSVTRYFAIFTNENFIK